MKPDFLSEATRALRAEHGGASDAASSTERLILARVRRQSERRFWRLRWLLPAVALLVVSSAAARVGPLFPSLSRLTESWFREPAHAPKVSSPKPARLASANPTSIATATASALPSPPPAPFAIAKPVAANRGKPSSHTAAASSAATLSQAPPEPEELYRAAHRSHFVDRDPAAALTAWDRYLQAAPRGALVLEARYNRALALARLGRNVEAVSALEPFARGEYGPYRQAEARALVDKLTP